MCTMTVVNDSDLILWLLALATITLRTQPVRRDANEGESTSTGGCISDWMGLNKAYLERQSSADVENSIFDFHPSDGINYGVVVMFYNMGHPHIMHFFNYTYTAYTNAPCDSFSM